jgi:hypothetical protein
MATLSLANMVTNVQKFIQRTSIGSNPSIQDMLLNTIIWLEGLDYWPWRFMRDSSTISLASATWSYSLPGDFGTDFALVITENNKEDELERIAFDDFIRKWPDPSANSGGQPTNYTIGFKAGSAGVKQLWFSHPADGTYSCDLWYWQVRTDAVGTTLETGLNEVEKLALIRKTAAMIEGGVLKISTCNGQPTCECNACAANRWLLNLQNRKRMEKLSAKPRWKHPYKQGHGGWQYDVRGQQKTYNTD